MLIKRMLQPHHDCRFFAFLLSLCLSYLWFSYQQPISHDGINYLETAEAFLQGGYAKALAHYPWPFYSLLIAYLSKFLHLSLLNSAYILDAFLIAFLVFNFITVCRTLGGSVRIQYLAALCILLYPPLAHERFLIIRDFGYMSFELLALNFLLNYQKNKRYFSAVLFASFSVVAALFRIEGFIFLISAPFFFLFMPNENIKNRLLLFFKPFAFTLGVALVGVLLMLSSSIAVNKMGRLHNALSSFGSTINEIIGLYTVSVAAIKFYVIRDFGKSHAPQFYLGGLFGILITVFLEVFNPFYIVFAMYAVIKKILPFSKEQWIILLGFIILNVTLQLVFLAEYLFLDPRYMMMLAILLLLLVPFALDKIIFATTSNLKRHSILQYSFVAVTGTILALSSLLHIGSSGTFYIDAGHWVSQNLPQERRIFTNDERLQYYGARNDLIYNFVVEAQTLPLIMGYMWQTNSSYAIFYLSKNQVKDLDKGILGKIKIVKTFKNNKGDMIVVLTK